MPSEHDDDNHDEIATTTIAGTTQAITPGPTPTASPTENPNDHPDRPVNEKPADAASSPTSTNIAPAAESTTPSSWLPSFFPSFGVSSKTQIWIYGAAALILIFCIGLAIFFYLARRRRLRNNPRDEWEFDLLEEDEAEGLNGGSRAAGKKGTKRRAGELYDAFAAGSDDESGGEYADDDNVDADVGGDEREKRLYDDTEEEESHVVGDDESEDEDTEDEKARGKLLQR
jgi:kexin